MLVSVKLRKSGSPGVGDDMDVRVGKVFRKQNRRRLADRQDGIGNAVAEKEIGGVNQSCIFRDAHQNVIAFEHIDFKACRLRKFDIFLQGRVL